MKNKPLKSKKSPVKSLFAIIAGILLISFSVTFLADYNDFFRFLGIMLIIGGVLYFFFFRNIQNIFISDEELSKLVASNQLLTTKTFFPKISISMILLIIIILSFLFNQFFMWKTGTSSGLNKLFSINVNITRK